MRVFWNLKDPYTTSFCPVKDCGVILYDREFSGICPGCSSIGVKVVYFLGFQLKLKRGRRA